MSRALAILALTPILASCASSTPESKGGTLFESGFESPAFDRVEATSLLGESLIRPSMDREAEAKQERLLEQARADLAAEPRNVDHQIWVGRRLAYLGRYREAISHYSRAIEKSPDDPRLYRHRGHRYLTVRKLDAAEKDLERAAALTADRPDEIEPDGLPNAAGTPTSTLKTNIEYHLGLARYLKGDWNGALDAYRKCLDLSHNDDMAIATEYWLYMTLRRAGRDAEAKELLANVPNQVELLESGDYHRLLLLFRGDLSVDDLLGETRASDNLSSATIGYGVGVHLLLNGDETGALEMFRRVTSSESWAPFGYLAAEAELARSEAVRQCRGDGVFGDPTSGRLEHFRVHQIRWTLAATSSKGVFDRHRRHLCPGGE